MGFSSGQTAKLSVIATVRKARFYWHMKMKDPFLTFQKYNDNALPYIRILKFMYLLFASNYKVIIIHKPSRNEDRISRSSSAIHSSSRFQL